MNRTKAILTTILLSSIPLKSYCADIFANFDDIPTTSSNAIPSSGDTWNYVSNSDNSSFPVITNCGWWKKNGYADSPSIHNYIHYYLNGYNTTHMGFSTYGYFEIDGSNSVKGNSLKITTTGGVTTLDGINNITHGSIVRSKEDYLKYLSAGQNPIDSTGKVGHPYIYFGNNDSVAPYQAIPEANGATRMSFYVYMPDGVNNGAGGYASPPAVTANVGPFNGTGAHWYHDIVNRGGGWTHVVIDSHPQHNNSWSNAAAYPYPSYSLRALGSDYFSTMYRWYITFKPYTGIGTPPYYTWIDEVEFQTDLEPQNDETIANPAITYYPSTKSFEIGFNDKYKNLSHSYSTYEMRYSFSQITNANWESATPVSIQADSRFAIEASPAGIFKKWWPYYQAVWAPFKLQQTDEKVLEPGTTVYFAIKDVSQNPSNLSVVNPAYNKGRSYSTYPEAYDYSGDIAALPYIKRIDYYVGGNIASMGSDRGLAPVIKVLNIK